MRFDFTNVPDAQDFEVILAGTQMKCIVEAAKETYSNNVQGCVMFEMTLAVIEGPFENRKLWTRDIIQHPTSAKAVQIGLGRIKQLIGALSINPLEIDSANPYQLLNKVVMVTVGVEKGDAQYGPKNNIRKYEQAVGGNATIPAAPAAPFQPLIPPQVQAPQQVQAPPPVQTPAPAPFQPPPYAPISQPAQAPPPQTVNDFPFQGQAPTT